MTTLLAIETATEACSVALMHRHEIVEKYRFAPSAHAALVIPMISELISTMGLATSMVDAIAFGRGPGSFTGVRIAVSSAQGLGLAWDRPLIGISSLQAVAAASEHPRVLAAFDARKGELYWGCYVRTADALPVLQGTECVIAPERVSLPDDDGWYGLGSGWGAYGEALSLRLGAHLAGYEASVYPRAASVLRLAHREWRAGRAVDAEKAMPVYIRPSQAEENRS